MESAGEEKGHGLFTYFMLKGKNEGVVLPVNNKRKWICRRF
jgi:hypothetical protein